MKRVSRPEYRETAMCPDLMRVEEAVRRIAPADFHCLSQPGGTARAAFANPMQPMEKALLRYFREHSGRTLSREELSEKVWQRRHFHGSRAIDQIVAKLRKKLRRQEEKILSVRSTGYRFEVSGKGG